MSTGRNDEGMWLPYKLPTNYLKEQYGFTPSKEWIEHVERASVRMNNGGSASFVSPKGLLATNHHVAESVLHELSSKERDLVKNGYYAKTLAEELKAPALEVNILWEVEDVTDRVKSANKKGMDPTKSFEARRAEISRIENESFNATGLRSNVVMLYQGGQFHLYRYKKYTDVRLVFAPEKAIASFGDDFDNFEFPRFCFDVTYFRVYEDGKPLQTNHFFRWDSENSKEGTFAFISGHPGRTNRLQTLARILNLRDLILPSQLTLLRRQEIVLQQFAGRSPENKRRAQHNLHSIQNARKALLGQLQALQDPLFIEHKKQKEDELRKRIARNKDTQRAYGDAWGMVAKAEDCVRELRDTFNMWEGALAFNTNLFGIARAIVRMEEEDKKPDHKRLPECSTPNRDSLLHRLLSPAPVYLDLEEWTLADSLARMVETLGFNDPLVKKILSGKSPKARAHELIAGTKLDDVGERKRLIKNTDALKKTSDSLIMLAKLVDRKSRAIRKIFESEVEEVEKQAYNKIAQASFEVYGENMYPDATFTLRITFGRIAGYEDLGEHVPAFTTLGETIAHGEKHENVWPWILPESWLRKKNELQGNNRQFNFVSVHDTHGGNSGSPVFTPDLKIIGLLFDGNLQGLGKTFMYGSDETARSVSVHTAGIIEALQKIYNAERLVKELVG